MYTSGKLFDDNFDDFAGIFSCKPLVVEQEKLI